MAIRKQLTATTIEETRMVYSLRDPAVDVDASNTDAWFDTLEREHLVFSSEERPCRFEIRPLTKLELKRARLSAHAEAERRDGRVSQKALMMALFAEAFALGCLAIHDVEVMQADQSIAHGVVTRKEGFDWVDVDIVEEIGSYILRITTWQGGRGPGKS